MRHDLPLHEIDPRILTPKQWTALRSHVARRAHEGRSEALRDIGRAIAGWLRRSGAPAMRTARGAGPIHTNCAGL